MAFFTTIIATIPACVMGGICLVLYGFIASNGLRTLKIEGGQVFSINGGPCIETNYNGNVINYVIDDIVVKKLNINMNKVINNPLFSCDNFVVNMKFDDNSLCEITLHDYLMCILFDNYLIDLDIEVFKCICILYNTYAYKCMSQDKYILANFYTPTSRAFVFSPSKKMRFSRSASYIIYLAPLRIAPLQKCAPKEAHFVFDNRLFRPRRNKRLYYFLVTGPVCEH